MNDKPIDIFSKHYPIVTTDKDDALIHTIYIFDEICEPYEFAEIITLLDNAEPGDTVVFKLNTPGGRLDSTLSIIDAIASTKAHTIAEVSGDCASAGTMIALACDGLYVSEFAEFMCHNFSGGVGGKGHEIKARAEYILKNNADFMHSVYKKFLTKAEVELLIDGKDFYMGKKEVMERWEKVIAYRTKLIERAQKERQEARDAEVIEYLISKGYTVNTPEI